jgi:hypothetical protein
MGTLLIIRGLPGSGKSTLAAQIAAERGFPPPRAADDYFTDPEGRYTFNPALLGAGTRRARRASPTTSAPTARRSSPTRSRRAGKFGPT